MPQNFLACDRDQSLLLPPDMREWLAEDHFAWFVIEAVEALDLAEFFADYRDDGHGFALEAQPGRSQGRPLRRRARSSSSDKRPVHPALSTKAPVPAWISSPPPPRPDPLSGGVTFVSPGGAVFDSEDAPLAIEAHDSEPAIVEEAESIGDFDLRVPSGCLVLEESGGGGGRAEMPVPIGVWRARWSGFGEKALEKQGISEQGVGDPRPDHYLLQLWPASAAVPITRLRG